MRTKLGLLATVAAAAAALLTPGVAHAASCTYTGANNGTWDSAGNWSCAAIPGANDDVTLSTNAVVISTVNESAKTLTMGTGTVLAFSGSHSLTVSGLTTFNAASGSQAQVDGAGTLAVQSITWSSGDVCVSNGATLSVVGALTIPAGVGTLPCNSGGSKVVVASGGSLVQSGGTRTVASAVEVDGSLEVAGGSLQLAAGPNTDDGSLTADGGTTLKINGNRTLGATGSIGGPGLVDVSAGFLTVPSGATLNPTSLQIEGSVTANGTPALALPTLTFNGGTLDGSRNRTIHTLVAHDGTLGGNNTTLIDTAFSTDGPNRLTFDVTNATTTANPSWSGTGDICVSNGGTLTIPTGHTLTIPAGVGTLPCNSGGSKVVVASGGSLVQSGGTRTVASAVEVDGSLEVAGGSLQLAAGPNTDDGSLTADGGTTLKINGNRTLGATGSIGGPGLVDVSAGTLTVPDGASFTPTSLQLESIATVNGTAPTLVIPTLTLNGGTLDGSRNRTIHTLVAHDGTLGGNNTTLIDTAFSTDGANRLTFDVTNATTTVAPSWSGVGDICVSNGGILQLNATLTTGGSSGSFPCSTGGSKVVVGSGGSIVRTGPGTSTFATPVEASGSGLVNVVSGQTFNFNGGLTLLSNGTLKGVGTIGGPVANTSGTVAPGNSAGTLTLTGSYSQGGGGKLAIEVVNPSSVDKLVVGGSASLGGTLAVTNTGQSGPGPYVVLSATGGRSGTFSSTTFTGGPYTVDYGSSDVTLTNGPPTAVRLLSFSARRSLLGVTVGWRTAQEAGVLGFVVYRDGMRVNRRLITARGGLTGADYRLLDLRAGHRYRLQAVRTDGRRSWVASARA